METITTLYNLLGIRQKIQDQRLRILYLKDVWGLPQSLIMECESLNSQPAVSRIIKEARMTYGVADIKNTAAIQFSPEEIKYIQFLPREIISDTEVIAFMNNILGLNIVHSFYSFSNASINRRITSLSGLGIQNKHLEKIFKKSQPNISMIIKRKVSEYKEFERINRYDDNEPFHIQAQFYRQSFIMSGGN